MRNIQCFVGYHGYSAYDLFVSVSQILSAYHKKAGHLRLAERTFGRPSEDISESNFGAYAKGKKARFNKSWLEDFQNSCSVEDMLSIMNNGGPIAGWEQRLNLIFRGVIQAVEQADCEQTDDYLQNKAQIDLNGRNLANQLRAVLSASYPNEMERRRAYASCLYHLFLFSMSGGMSGVSVDELHRYHQTLRQNEQPHNNKDEILPVADVPTDMATIREDDTRHSLSIGLMNTAPVLVSLTTGHIYMGKRGDTIIGRKSTSANPQPTIVINDKAISRRHCQLSPCPNSPYWKICDLQSTNGTYVNHMKLDPGVPTEVTNYALLQLGKQPESRFMVLFGLHAYDAARRRYLCCMVPALNQADHMPLCMMDESSDVTFRNFNVSARFICHANECYLEILSGAERVFLGPNALRSGIQYRMQDHDILTVGTSHYEFICVALNRES